MAELELKQNDIGIQFIVTITSDGSTAVDLTGCSNFKIVFTTPNKTKYSVDASILNTGEDGKIYYISTADDLTITGRWKIQVHYSRGSNIRYTSIDTFLVTSNL